MKSIFLLVFFTSNVFTTKWNKCDQRSIENKVAVRKILEYSGLSPSQVFRFPMWRRTFHLFVNPDAQLDKIVKRKKPTQITIGELNIRAESIKKFNLVIVHWTFFTFFAAMAIVDAPVAFLVLMPGLLHFMITHVGWNAFMKTIVSASTTKWQFVQFIAAVVLVIYLLLPFLGYNLLLAIYNNFCFILQSTGIALPAAYNELNRTTAFEGNACVRNEFYVQNFNEFKTQMVANVGMLAGYVANAVIEKIFKCSTCSSLNCRKIIWPTQHVNSIENSRIYEILNVSPHLSRNLHSFTIFENAATEEYLVIDKNGRLNDVDETMDLNHVDEYGGNLVNNAASCSQTKIVKFLATKNVDLDLPNKWNETPVWKAAWNGNTDLVKFLATKKVDLERLDEFFGAPPIWMAARNGNTETMKFLIDQGVDLEKTSKWGETLVEIAALYNRKEIVKLLLQKNVKFNKRLLQKRVEDEINWLITESYRVSKHFKIFQNIEDTCLLPDHSLVNRF